MSKKELLDVLSHENTSYVPWVPFCGVSNGKIISVSAEDMLKNEDNIVNGVLKARELFSPDGLPVVFDLQVEAEILGCELLWSKDTPPSVSSHPYAKEKKVPCMCKIPTKEMGRLPIILSATKRIKEKIGEDTAIYGLVCGPLTLASHLRGSDLFMDMVLDKNYVKSLMEFTTAVCIKMSEYYIEAGADVVAVVDPIVSQVSPKYFVSDIAPFFKDIFASIKLMDRKSAFFVCGNATKHIEAMAKCGSDVISVDENVNVSSAKEICDREGVIIGGNIPLTTIMLHGTPEDNMQYALSLMDECCKDGSFILSPGCDLPYDTKIENIIAVSQTAKQPEYARELVKNYVKEDVDIPVELPDYDNLNKPLIEVFTLDSATCAACQYMMDAANVAKDGFGDKIDVVEYRYTNKDNFPRFKKMQITNLPSMYINGKLKYLSIIPTQNELFEEIMKYL